MHSTKKSCLFSFDIQVSSSLLVLLKRSWLKQDLAKKKFWTSFVVIGMETFIYYVSTCLGEGGGQKIAIFRDFQN